MILATDEVFTYAIFNYININWSSHTEAGGDTTGGEGGVPAYVRTKRSIPVGTLHDLFASTRRLASTLATAPRRTSTNRTARRPFCAT